MEWKHILCSLLKDRTCSFLQLNYYGPSASKLGDAECPDEDFGPDDETDSGKIVDGLSDDEDNADPSDFLCKVWGG